MTSRGDDARRQAALDGLQASGRLPSVVAGMAREGRLTWTGRAGADAARQYRIGSLTKTFTAVLVVHCRDRGLLGLDDPLGRFVPESGYADATLRSLLAHHSGMQSEPVGPWWERSPGVPVEEVIAGNDGSGRVLAPGIAFHYSNLGYALLGEVVARVLDETWWTAVGDRLLAPLGLSGTTYLPGEGAAQGYSVDHFAGTLVPEPHTDTGGMAPAGQLWSTVADLAVWLDFLVTGHPEILAADSLAEMARPAGPAADYGLGLRLLEHGGRRLIGHTGSMPGFLASGFVDPVTRESAVLLCNATTGVETDRVSALLLDGTDEEPDEPWTPSADVPVEVREVLGLWFWGHSAQELRWHNGLLELRSLALGDRTDRFAFTEGGFVGVEGYHLGETLHVQRRATGAVSHLECATFRYTRTPESA